MGFLCLSIFPENSRPGTPVLAKSNEGMLHLVAE